MARSLAPLILAALAGPALAEGLALPAGSALPAGAALAGAGGLSEAGSLREAGSLPEAGGLRGSRTICRDPGTAPPAPGMDEGLVSVSSPVSVGETVARLRAAIRALGGKVFAEIDHGGGSPRRPAWLILFAQARASAPLLRAAPSAGLDLPLRVLVWEDAAGRVRATSTDPAWLARRYGLDPDGPPMRGTREAIARVLAAAR
ncbi:protein of unknown function DUF302 [Methylobacterium sp. 4-46]|uniref:DUF302 domain-containing protein n=1 Tax=unclassified Methylobacterium TaxID=2615210 RepID=UPI000152E4EF|nr:MULTISPECIES: DUF302 domain-containing protein [Methylobacterium]ACA20154.1 protein of unknown function DUF302 [Methylobacterium sp. 4-46]WFT79333.1 DUF302 domain-containing protein [Methylobacterium nodulans]